MPLGDFLNTEGAFDSTSNVTIKQVMILHYISEGLMELVEDMLAA